MRPIKKRKKLPVSITVSAEKNRTTKQRDCSKFALCSVLTHPWLIARFTCHSPFACPPILTMLVLSQCLGVSTPSFFISPYSAFHKRREEYHPNTDEKSARSSLTCWQATVVPLSLLLMIINYMSLTNMPRAILSHLSCAIDFTFWIHSN